MLFSELVYFLGFSVRSWLEIQETTSILSIVFKWKLQPWAQVLLSLIDVGCGDVSNLGEPETEV